MTSLDTSALQSLALRGKSKTERPGWRPLELSELNPGLYLGCDQSLAAAGLVLFEVGAERDRWTVHVAQKITIVRTEHSGWEDILQRALTLDSHFKSFMHAWITDSDWDDIMAVHEAPPIGGGKLVNPEISLIAAYAFRCATLGLRQLPMVRRQDHAKLICGNGNATKAQHHAALKPYFEHIRGSTAITNEATRDALSVAIFAARRARKDPS
jgi:hypothetical protein